MLDSMLVRCVETMISWVIKVNGTMSLTPRLSMACLWSAPKVRDPYQVSGLVSLKVSKGVGTVNSGVQTIRNTFGTSVDIKEPVMRGNVRPGENKGHEHFGYDDGVSQPSLRCSMILESFIDRY